MKVTAIIVGGGESTRMNQNKQLMEIRGKPAIVYTLEQFQNHSLITDIVLVRPKQLAERFDSILKKYNFSKVVAQADGGILRQDSVFNGLQKITDCDIVLIHNGANILVTSDEIKNCIEEAFIHGAAAVAHFVKDTIKSVDKESFVVKTFDRSSLRSLQTPQCIRYDLMLKAFNSLGKGVVITDDVQSVELIGEKVKLVPASPENIKLTTPADVLFAELVLQKREKR